MRSAYTERENFHIGTGNFAANCKQGQTRSVMRIIFSRWKDLEILLRASRYIAETWRPGYIIFFALEIGVLNDYRYCIHHTGAVDRTHIHNQDTGIS